MNHWWRAGLLAGLVTACVAVQAQSKTVYKVRLPDGTIEFTDSPPSNAKVLETIEPKPNATLPRPPAASAAPPAAATAATRTQALEAANKEVAAAELALTDARRAREDGREPRDGEIRGTKGGGARHLPAYDERQKSLEDAVVAAEERVKRAHEARNALR